MDITLTIRVTNMTAAYNDIVRAIRPFMSIEEFEGCGFIVRMDVEAATNVDFAQLLRRMALAAAGNGYRLSIEGFMDLRLQH